MQLENIRWRVEDGVGVATLDRPKALNALDRKTIDELHRLLDAVAADPAVKALVLTGASEKARFGQPEVNLGLIPGFGGSQRLARRVGLMRAKELVFTGDMVDAQKAKAIGLALEVLPPEGLLPHAIAVAKKIASRGPAAVAAAKRVMEAGAGVDLRTGCALELEAFALLFASDDAREGTRAFVEKRPAVFQGR